MNKYIKSYLEYRRGCGMAPKSIKRSYYYLNRFFTWLKQRDVRDTTGETIMAYIAYLKTLKNNRKEPLKERSIETELSGLKSFYIHLYKCDKILTNPFEGLKLKQKGSGRSTRKIFSEENMGRFLDHIDTDTPETQRDRALFELTYSSGLRVNEVLELTYEDLDFENRVGLVMGKGQKERYVPFSKAAGKFLMKYIKSGRKYHTHLIRKAEYKPYLFLSKAGKLTWSGLQKRFRKYLAATDLAGKGYTLHSIRHATATHLLSHGTDIRYIQELLGHESMQTTQVYTRPCEEDIKRVYRCYHPRENEYYRELDSEYLNAVCQLKNDILRQRKEKMRRKRNSALKKV